MKIPKHIQKLLEQHIKLGEKLNDVNIKLFRWLDSKGIHIEPTDIYCVNSIMIITEPRAYASGIKEIIQEKQ